MEETYRVTTKLLGELTPRTVMGAFQPRRADLIESLEGPDSFMHAFCQGCGLVFELTHKGKTLFQSEFSLTIPDDPQGYYLNMTRCMYCDTRYRDSAIRQIPSEA